MDLDESETTSCDGHRVPFPLQVCQLSDNCPCLRLKKVVLGLLYSRVFIFGGACTCKATYVRL